MNETEKTNKRSISATPTLWAHADRRARDHYRGRVSTYIQDLIEADMQGAAPNVAPDQQEPLAQLYGAFIPAMRPLMQDWLDRNGIDQALLISDLLAALADYAADHAELDRGQPRRFYVLDCDPAEQLRTESMQRLERWLAADEAGLNELEDMSHAFQRNRRAGVTGKERDAVRAWLDEHPRSKRPKVSEVDAWLAEHHPDVNRDVVHHLLMDHGVRAELDADEEIRESIRRAQNESQRPEGGVPKQARR